ncbi:hypothetical protein [Clostridium paraputrificum]|uniref:hypothetical protein n=1 Tax=Clostridium paraputrificum TaxID=29363 RepID=UPI000D9AF2E6|nr:hypothetical protein [Clostridium paraputrificum]SQB99865.1 Uncharacterised protein [Clostridium paraputrificum]
MYFKRSNYENDMEILVTEKNLVTFSGTVVASGVESNAEGKKIVKAGSFIDATGAVVKPSGSSFEGNPIGVLYKTVDVTNGDAPASIIVEGYLREDRVFDGFDEGAKTAAKAKVPNIKFR